jgi:membrane carboxypeptidase/penicillin-binding protein PbpC
MGGESFGGNVEKMHAEIMEYLGKQASEIKSAEAALS